MNKDNPSFWHFMRLKQEVRFSFLLTCFIAFVVFGVGLVFFSNPDTLSWWYVISHLVLNITGWILLLFAWTKAMRKYKEWKR